MKKNVKYVTVNGQKYLVTTDSKGQKIAFIVNNEK